jgi:hypothetical protein
LSAAFHASMTFPAGPRLAGQTRSTAMMICFGTKYQTV